MAYQLATSIRDLEEYLQGVAPQSYVGFDTEASSLDTRKARIAGLSLSKAEGDAIYAPLGHNLGTNLDKKEVAECLALWFDSDGLKPVFYNAKYDVTILQTNLRWRPDTYYDALCAVYLEDPDRKQKGLKLVSKQDLGFDMDKFEGLFTLEEQKAKDFDIRRKHPRNCCDYACSDADATLRVWKAKSAVREEQKFAMTVDVGVVEVVRYMEHNGGMLLNQDYIDAQLSLLEERADHLRTQVHRMVGYAVEINSPKKLGEALFDRMGLPSPGMTKSRNPQHVTNAAALEKLALQYPVVGYILAYRKVEKARSTYFKKLRTLLDSNFPIRFKFNTFSAPTFRFSAPGGSPEKDGGCGVNIQAVSNGEVMSLNGVDLSLTNEETYQVDMDEEDMFFEVQEVASSGPAWTREELLKLPYVVEDETFGDPKLICIRETCSGCNASCESQGIDVTRRMQSGLKMIPSVRNAFRAPDGFQMVSCDYDRQELVIGANLSREPNWLGPLARGEDLHAVTAAGILGISPEEFAEGMAGSRKAYFSRIRAIGKMLNFAAFYGATAWTLSYRANIPQAQADQIYEAYRSRLKVLFHWMARTHLFARKEGYTTTYFGREEVVEEILRFP